MEKRIRRWDVKGKKMVKGFLMYFDTITKITIFSSATKMPFFHLFIILWRAVFSVSLLP